MQPLNRAGRRCAAPGCAAAQPHRNEIAAAVVAFGWVPVAGWTTGTMQLDEPRNTQNTRNLGRKAGTEQPTEACLTSTGRRAPPPAFSSSVFLSCGSCISWFTRINPYRFTGIVRGGRQSLFLGVGVGGSIPSAARLGRLLIGSPGQTSRWISLRISSLEIQYASLTNRTLHPNVRM